MVVYTHKVSPCVAKQIILAVDDDGNFLEYIPKEAGHRGKGRRHLAITVLLYNSKGEVLLQKRKHQLFNNLWDFTGATHPLHKPHPCHPERLAKDLKTSLEIPRFARNDSVVGNDEKCRICGQDNMDETLEEATWRCLEEEWEISPTSSSKAGLRGVKDIRGFNYFAKDGEYCENEHCFLMVGEYDGEVNMSQDVGYEYKWMRWSDFLQDIETNPKKYTPWAVEGAKILEQSKFVL